MVRALGVVSGCVLSAWIRLVEKSISFGSVGDDCAMIRLMDFEEQLYWRI
jgi:hypothetical protein